MDAPTISGNGANKEFTCFVGDNSVSLEPAPPFLVLIRLTP